MDRGTFVTHAYVADPMVQVVDPAPVRVTVIMQKAHASGARQPHSQDDFPNPTTFGTDGIRGVAGEFPLTMESTFLIGRALGHDLMSTNPRARVVIGQDTRESSAWIADQVALGLGFGGCEVHSAGVITTPGVAYLARSREYAAGVVISASHNPWTDNGIKVFSGDGYKLPDARELAIEQEIFALLRNPEPPQPPAAKSVGQPAGRGQPAARLRRVAGAERERGPERAAGAGGLCQWRGGRGSAGAVSGLRNSGDVSQCVAGWQEHQRGMRRIASGSRGQSGRGEGRPVRFGDHV